MYVTFPGHRHTKTLQVQDWCGSLTEREKLIFNHPFSSLSHPKYLLGLIHATNRAQPIPFGFAKNSVHSFKKIGFARYIILLLG